MTRRQLLPALTLAVLTLTSQARAQADAPFLSLPETPLPFSLPLPADTPPAAASKPLPAADPAPEQSVSPNLASPDDLVVPYGSSPATLRTTPLYVSTIAFEPGEAVLNAAMGDSSRWLITNGEAGSGAGTTQLLFIKPSEANLSTNLTVATTRRLYSIELQSFAPSPGQAPTRLLRFSYPQDTVLRFARQEAEAQHLAETTSPLAAERLHFNYRISGRAPWSVIRIFDDGARTYIALSANAPSPALVVLDSGSPVLVNYRVVGDYLVADGTFRTAQLIARNGKKQQSLSLERR